MRVPLWSRGMVPVCSPAIVPRASSIVPGDDAAKENIHEQAALVSQDPVRFGIWLRVAREMKCAEAKAMKRVKEEGSHLLGILE